MTLIYPWAAREAVDVGMRSAATENLDSLDDEYGITQAKLNVLQQKIDAFRTVQPKPRRTRASASAAVVESDPVGGS